MDQYQDKQLNGSLKFPGPPNLQLNLSPGKIFAKQQARELFCASIIAVILQISLLIIAIITVYHNQTKISIGYEPKPWGLSCYIIGSLLLSGGMAICSMAIEKSTVEFMWEPSEKNDAPRILWVQRSQRVNDQTFDSYVLLGGPKDYILTSSRQEDVVISNGCVDEVDVPDSNKGHQAETNNENQDDTEHVSTNVYTLPHRKTYIEKKQQRRDRWWAVVASAGALAGGVGFAIQFIGLRGLPWPCAVSQLGAIFLMAIVRAIVRRRLGRSPLAYRAPPEYELDYLAIQLAFNSNFREFQFGETKEEYLKYQTEKEICSWKVKTSSLGLTEFPFSESNYFDPR